ncbi:helix-turn-helix domain-containing protein [Modestobacter sp. NPDC049651]|uniref:helix-turn-helix domain-containing protein n=1 Tax=unclassified Modestobacter TaxID=2643866 RepID=UPI00340FF00E
MPSWTNATGGTAERADPLSRGVLHPERTQQVAGLRRDLQVHPALAPFVERWWSVRWDRTGQPPFRSEVLSHPSVNLSVEEGTSPRFGVALPAVLVHGVVVRRFTIDLVGSGRVTAAKFRPGGWAAFTGQGPAVGTVTPLGAGLGVDPARLLADLLGQDDDADRVAVLEAALVPVAPEPPAEYAELSALLAEMADDRSLLRVDQVADRAGLSVRSLQRRFATWVGVHPKAVLARYRLQDAAAAIDAGERDLAGLAASLGWFDQAHFSRDFRAAVGVPPSVYLARAVG